MEQQEIKNGTYTIPEGFTAKIEDGKIIVEKNKESDDEGIRKSLVKYFRKFKPKDMWDEMFSIGDILAYLKKQKERQPAELSEEDEERLFYDILVAEKVWGADSPRVKFLKSLRPQPHWKPSEEQMKLLRHVTGLLQGKDCRKKFADFVYELKHNLCSYE